MAFVTSVGIKGQAVAGSKCSAFNGNVVSGARPASKATVTMGIGNQSLDTLGLEKDRSENFFVSGIPMAKADPQAYAVVVDAVYKFVFGNAYIMESERKEMAVPESQFKLGQYTVKEFVMALAMTDQYKNRFFENRPLYGAIELNFKHFLGRTPDGLEEYRKYSAVYDSKGYEAFVMSFFDEEYDQAYGDWTVPYYRGYRTDANISMSSFTHFFKVVRGNSTSDKASLNNKIPLNQIGISKTPVTIKAPGGPVYIEGFTRPGSQGNSINSAPSTRHGSVKGKMYRIEISNLKQTAARGRAGISAVGSVYGRNNGYSKFARANKAIIVSGDELSKRYQEITKNGGKICSVTPL
mmetsp:Transcript_7061/g.21548  ORF Transcript_7061/g.21548 Transcript_7061/m.21548 type:complete len:352 (+) Transcript_7061:72-1127(+)|eukprot:CAMPEP_0198723876 /NCGR_PEP_ID=MMETSP1475-20131203/1345_1 /TAXON_ID= ORGANISM="Unidentified sp., Strain CCMP1999" /NCGR_SAMPLE_ID=MMETSP1475 /ASSEMBLY_ACC=CAM_ASM_001111 /LENGTH=351 /DNA_ID=CAMNT_0044485193 /DNA_START=69 /DNA_END=1124 /DNA_ORIENTATION=-